MAAINFVKGEQYYTAEFQINGPVNVHIERAEAGALYFRQRSIDHGSYDLINGANWNNRGALTIDTAIQGVVYPMWIKIESASEPTLAEMVEGEQSGGGAGESGENIEYLDVSEFKFSDNEQENTFRLSFIKNMGLFGKAFVNQGYIIGPIGFAGSSGTLKSIAIDFSGITYDNTAGGDIIKLTVKEALIALGFPEEMLAAIPRITKEQFYSLEA